MRGASPNYVRLLMVTYSIGGPPHTHPDQSQLHKHQYICWALSERAGVQTGAIANWCGSGYVDWNRHVNDVILGFAPMTGFKPKTAGIVSANSSVRRVENEISKPKKFPSTEERHRERVTKSPSKCPSKCLSKCPSRNTA